MAQWKLFVFTKCIDIIFQNE